MWRFVSGLTGFQFFKDNVHYDAFGVQLTQIHKHTSFGHMLAIKGEANYENFDFLMYNPNSDSCPIAVSNLFLHCLFEGQIYFNYEKDFGHAQCTAGRSPLDKYVAGYCIAHSSSTTSISWKVDMLEGSDESFV